MKKIIVTGIVLVLFVLYAVFYQKSSTNANPIPAASNTTGSTSRGTYKDGTYTGSTADAFYGTLQVKATIANGKISDVQFLKYPNDQAESIEVNKEAIPTLTQEAIQTQNSKVDIVTGATQTSEAFRVSLASALSQAK
ncbi:MAG TPA: FMN-binding protein [Candidatus Saccharimonadales bacterium]|nr:FMN-binding protein [Candidatus Saccharimonadales bacterium]